MTPAPRVVLIGLPSAGKTVLTAVFARSLLRPDALGRCLVPRNNKTLKWVEAQMQRLNAGEWPASTPQGETNELAWDFHLGPKISCQLRLADLAGQDLRRIFGVDDVAANVDFPPQLQAVRDYCRSADVVLLLINLQDFIGEQNPEAKAANDGVLKSVVDDLCGPTDGRRVCLVLTQADRYLAEHKAQGGWLPLIEKHLPNLYYAHVHTRHVGALAVSAVRETTIDHSGRPRRVPKPGFRSEGLGNLAKWLGDAVSEVAKNAREKHVDVPQVIVSELKVDVADATSGSWGGRLTLFLFAALTIWWIATKLTGRLGAAKAPIPVAVVVGEQSTDSSSLGDHYVNHVVDVRNDGVGGNIRVDVVLTENGHVVEAMNGAAFLNAGETRQFSFRFWKLYDYENPHHVTTHAAAQ